MGWNQIASVGMAVWRDAEDICALSDDDRHLGHVVNEGEWHAFDAVHPNLGGNGIGIFATLDDAKAAVERSVSAPVEIRARRAASVVRIR